MKPRERTTGKGWFNSRPLYRDLVLRAKEAGIANAVAHQTHFGYSNHGRLQDEGFEIPNPDLTMCVELIAPRDQLEDFCRLHGALLANKVIVYKHLKQWGVIGSTVLSRDAL